jgi:hypothetical protein
MGDEEKADDTGELNDSAPLAVISRSPTWLSRLVDDPEELGAAPSWSLAGLPANWMSSEHPRSHTGPHGCRGSDVGWCCWGTGGMGGRAERDMWGNLRSWSYRPPDVGDSGRLTRITSRFPGLARRSAGSARIYELPARNHMQEKKIRPLRQVSHTTKSSQELRLPRASDGLLDLLSARSHRPAPAEGPAGHSAGPTGRHRPKSRPAMGQVHAAGTRPASNPRSTTPLPQRRPRWWLAAAIIVQSHDSSHAEENILSLRPEQDQPALRRLTEPFHWKSSGSSTLNRSNNPLWSRSPQLRG